MRENGFTLIETLIVLAIGALLLAGISNAIASFVPALTRVQINQEKAQDDANIRALAKLLNASRFANNNGEPLEQKLNSISFMARLPMASGMRGYILHKLEFVNDNGGASLKLRIGEASNSLPSVTIISGIDKVIFPKQTDLVSRSSDDVDTHQVSEIIIRRQSAEDINIPIKPIVTETKVCIFDPISQVCRQ